MLCAAGSETWLCPGRYPWCCCHVKGSRVFLSPRGHPPSTAEAGLQPAAPKGLMWLATRPAALGSPSPVTAVGGLGPAFGPNPEQDLNSGSWKPNELPSPPRCCCCHRSSAGSSVLFLPVSAACKDAAESRGPVAIRHCHDSFSRGFPRLPQHLQGHLYFVPRDASSITVTDKCY